MSRADVPDVVTVDVQAGTTVLLTSDLHLAPTRTEASAWAETELSSVMADIEGPAMLILAGDIVELWAVPDPDASKAAAALAAHPDLVAAIAAFAAAPDRRVFCLPGNHDGRLGWDDDTMTTMAAAFRGELAFAVELTLATTEGPRTVRVEHGHRFDPANAFHDPRDPHDTPLGQHVVQEVLPELVVSGESFMAGAEALADPRTFPAFITSRVFYRKMLRAARWLLLPLVLAIGMHWGIVVLSEPKNFGFTAEEFLVLDVGVVALTLVIGLVVFVAGRRAWRSASTAVAEKRGKGQNDNARAAAAELLGQGYAGMVSGHTHHPELTALNGGFYANTGSGTKVVDRVDARFKMPHVFLARVQLSWVVLAATASGWRAQLFAGRRPAPGATAIERAVAIEDDDLSSTVRAVHTVG